MQFLNDIIRYLCEQSQFGDMNPNKLELPLRDDDAGKGIPGTAEQVWI